MESLGDKNQDIGIKDGLDEIKKKVDTHIISKLSWRNNITAEGLKSSYNAFGIHLVFTQPHCPVSLFSCPLLYPFTAALLRLQLYRIPASSYTPSASFLMALWFYLVCLPFLPAWTCIAAAFCFSPIPSSFPPVHYMLSGLHF